MPKLDTQPLIKACATVIAVMSGIGMVSGQRVNRSMTVKRYEYPFDGGRGPIRSSWTALKRASGVANVASGDTV